MGNFEIQAKIDIERHPEWGQFTKNLHLMKGRAKDNQMSLDEILLSGSSVIGWTHNTATRGLRAQSYFIDETDYWDYRPIISPNVFRMEVLGDVRI